MGDHIPDELVDAIGQLNALMAATHSQLLSLVAVYDRAEAWRADGASSMTDWLTTRLGLSHSQAHAVVGVARALEGLPAIAATYAEGRLSFDQLRVVCTIATPDTDAAWADEAPGMSVATLQRHARRRTRPSDDGAEAVHRDRSLRIWHERDGQGVRLSGRMGAAEGAVVEKALSRLANQAPNEPDPGAGPDSSRYTPFDARMADALVDICSGRIADDADPDRATVVVHIDSETLTSAHAGRCELADGSGLALETARRLACDARLDVVLEKDGGPIGVGRASRHAPPRLDRLVRHRADSRCEFPGCHHTRWLHVHHIHHWAKGGPTDLDNLLLLCPFHHRLVHEGRWQIRGPARRPTFLDPNGHALTIGPPGLRPEIHDAVAA
jgi:hypothetical protein